MSNEIQQPKLVIVEGTHEESFFNAALKDHLSISDVQVLPIGGKPILRPRLKMVVGDPSFGNVQTLAVIRDADSTTPGSMVSAAESAFQSVCDSLQHVGLPPPASHGAFAPGPPRVGVFIMPNGSNDGMLETLCMQSVETEPEFHCLMDYFICLSNHGVRPIPLDKAHAHAWLASRPEPDKHLGKAAQAGYWPWDSRAFDNLWVFLRSM